MGKLYDRFVKELWPINPTGDPTDAYKSLDFCLSFSENIDGKRFTFDLIKERWEGYNHYIDSRNAGREKMYYSKKVQLFEYLEQKMFLQDYKASDKNHFLDRYLYGEGESD